jgi:hypothetical protein
MKVHFSFASFLTSAVVLICWTSAVSADDNPRNNWGRTALGPNITLSEWKPAPEKRPLVSHRRVLPVQGKALELAKAGKSQAIVALPQIATASSQAAAKLLQRIFKAMAGVELLVAEEGEIQAQGANFQVEGKSFDYLISLGDTRFAQSAGINARDLALDGYRLQTSGNTLFIVGQDRAPRPGHEGTPLRIANSGVSGNIHANGTLHGTYALLERHFGCRWLWPAEDGGEIIPRRESLVLQPLHESDEPAIAQRIIRNYYPEQGVNAYGRRQQQTVLPLLNRSYTSLVNKAKNSNEWFTAMGLGQSILFNTEEPFTAYWRKYSETHPEWFALQADGTRNQGRGTGDLARISARARLDVSNPELIEFIAQEIIQKFDADPTLTSASIAPNDGSYPSFCLCEVCRRLDPPQGEPVYFSIMDKAGKTSRIEYPSLSDRYVHFYSQIADIVAKKYPEHQLMGLAYSTYSSPPLYAKLSPNVVISYVGLSYFNDDQRAKDVRGWEDWARSASQMRLRPNALLGGYGMPAVFTHKLGQDFKRMYQTGMVGMDWDALTHNWAGRGLNYYVLAKLAWDPSLDVDALIKDYCDSGFGPASLNIQKYFAELEKITDEAAARVGDSVRAEDGIDVKSMKGAIQMLAQSYTPERIEALQAILNEAKAQAKSDQAVLERIVFLEQALRYARVQANLFGAYFAPRSPERKQNVQKALQERLAVFTDIYDNHFYAQGIFETLYRQSALWQEFGLDGAGRELKVAQE